MPEMSPVELAHSQLVNRFLMPEGGTPCARGIVSAIAVGVTPDDDGCGERPHIFIDAAAASCEKEAVVREAAELAKPFVPSVLRFGPFEGLQAGLGAGIAPVAANRYNIPPATAGTYGATFQANSRWYLLGSNHVLGNNGRTPQGTPVCEPGPIDALNGGKPIAAYRGCVPLIASAANAADCAWAELSAPPSPANPPEVTTVAATSGMQVAKTGRSTRTTTSRIRFRKWHGFIDFGFGTYYFADQLATWDAAGTNPSFATPGDSGALVTAAGSNTQGIGLVCARGYQYSRRGEFEAYVIVICPLSAVVSGIVDHLPSQPKIYAV